MIRLNGDKAFQLLCRLATVETPRDAQIILMAQTSNLWPENFPAQIKGGTLWASQVKLEGNGYIRFDTLSYDWASFADKCEQARKAIREAMALADAIAEHWSPEEALLSA